MPHMPVSLFRGPFFQISIVLLKAESPPAKGMVEPDPQLTFPIQTKVTPGFSMPPTSIGSTYSGLSLSPAQRLLGFRYSALPGQVFTYWP